MNYYPVMLNLKNRKVLIVGAGHLAIQKLSELLLCEARVTVLAKQIQPEILKISKVTCIRKEFSSEDAKGYFLIVGATSDRTVNEQVAKAAHEYRALVNIVDMTDLCDYIMPSIVRNGKLTVTISTSGAAPFFAKWLGGVYGKYLDLVEPIRKRIIDQVDDPEERKKILNRMLDDRVYDLIRVGQADEARQLLEELTQCQIKIT